MFAQVSDSSVGQDNRVELRLAPQVTVSNVAELLEAVVALANRACHVVVSCDDVERLDASALQVLLALRNELRAKGKTLIMRGLSEELSRMLSFAGVRWNSEKA